MLKFLKSKVVKIILISAIFFLVGNIFNAIKPYPYLPLSNLYFKNYEKLINFFNSFNQLNTKSLEKENNKNYTNLNDLVETSRTVDSMVLPLLIKKYDISKIYPNVSRKGGICSTGDDIIFFNSNAKLLIFDDETKNILINKDLIDNIYSIKANEFHINDIHCEKSNLDGNYTFYISIIFRNNDFYNQHILQVKIKNNKINIFKSLWKFKNTKKNNAGRIISTDKNSFYVSFTDHTDDPTKIKFEEIDSQNLSKLEGKIIKVNFKDKSEEIFSLGHRQVQGMFIDKEQNIYATEHGPKGGDEFNLINKGSNYGWPLSSHGVDYDSYDPIYGTYGRHDKFQKPIFSWNPGIGISQLIKLENFHEFWNDDFIISSLKNKTLYRTRLNSKKSVEFVEEIFIGNRIRDILQNKNKLYLWTDEYKLIEITNVIITDRYNPDYNNALIAPCLSCHHIGITNSTHAAPTLANIFNRTAGSDPNYNYSKAFENVSFQWTKKNLIEYILNPDDFLPGTLKQRIISNRKKAISVIDKLEEYTSN